MFTPRSITVVNKNNENKDLSIGQQALPIPNYVNSWENVRAFAQHVLVYNYDFYKSFNATFGEGNQAFNQLSNQEKIIKLNEWIDSKLNSAIPGGSPHSKVMREYPALNVRRLKDVSDYHRPLARLKKFINNQVERIEAQKQVDFIIKNSYSKIKKKLKRNFLGNIGKFFTDKQIDNENTRSAMVKNHVTSISSQYANYARFSDSISKLKSLNQNLFYTPKEYQTKINWHAVYTYVDVALLNSRTHQTRHRAKIRNKLSNIILSGASDTVKVSSLYYFLHDSMREMIGYKRLSNTLDEIYTMLFPNNKNIFNPNVFNKQSTTSEDQSTPTFNNR